MLNRIGRWWRGLRDSTKSVIAVGTTIMLVVVWVSIEHPGARLANLWSSGGRTRAIMQRGWQVRPLSFSNTAAIGLGRILLRNCAFGDFPKDKTDEVKEVVAKKISDVARSGERDAPKICARALIELGLPLRD